MFQNIIVAFHRCSRGMLSKETQKQPSRGVLRKRCSENMQQIYSRTPILKCDFTFTEEVLNGKRHFFVQWKSVMRLNVIMFSWLI